MDDAFDSVPVRPGWRNPALASGLALLTVVVAWLFGGLPWVLDGFRPSGPTAGSDGLAGVQMPIPLAPGQLSALVAFTLIGAVAALLLPMGFTDLPRGVAVTISGLVLAVTTLVLTLVARSVVSDHASSGFAGDPRVLDGLVIGVFGLAALGGFLGALSSFQIGFLPVAVAAVLSQLPEWFDRLGANATVLDLTSLVLLTAAFVLSIRRTLAWAALWPFALLIVWAGPAVSAGVLVVGTRLRPGQGVGRMLGDILSNGYDVFSSALGTAPRTWWPWAVALVIGVVWLVVRHVRSTADR